MKPRLLLTTLFFALITHVSFSQKVNFGVMAGIDLNKLKGKSFDEEFKLGYNAGAFVEIKIQKIGIQPEVYFSQSSGQSRKNISSDAVLYGVNTKVHLNYLNIPILVNYYFNPNVALQFGPQYSILFNENVSAIQNGENAFKKGDFSLNGGLQFKISRFRVYGRYIVGLNDLNDVTNNEKWKNQVVHLGLAYTIL
ncbi:MAG: porin family protein [Ferruginibacter sp.]